MEVNGVGQAAVTFSRQWQRCAGFDDDLREYPRATGSTYVSTRQDIAQRLNVKVTATFNGSPGTYDTGLTFLVIERKPVNEELPTVVGDSVVGATLSSSAGAWTANTPTFERQWLVLRGHGVGCSPVSGATGTTFPLTSALLGKRLQVRVTAIATMASRSAPRRRSPRRRRS